MIREETRECFPSTFAEFPPTPVLSSHEMFINNHVRFLRLTLTFEYLLEQLKFFARVSAHPLPHSAHGFMDSELFDLVGAGYFGSTVNQQIEKIEFKW